MQESQPRILLVEDDNELSATLAKALESCGLTNVVSCRTGVDAQALLAETSFDAIILDNILPGKTGIQLLSMISGNSKNASAKRYFMTGLLNASTEAQLKVFRVDAVYEKPFSFRELGQRIAQDLGLASEMNALEKGMAVAMFEVVNQFFLKLDPGFTIEAPKVTRGKIAPDQFRSLVPFFGKPFFGAIAVNFSKAGLIRYIGRSVDAGIQLDSGAPFDVGRELANQIAGEWKRMAKSRYSATVHVGLPYSDRLCELPLPVVGHIIAMVGNFHHSPMSVEFVLSQLE